MNIIGQDIVNLVKSVEGKDPHASPDNFFASRDPQDPHTRAPKKKTVAPKFNFKVFYLAGPAVDPMHGVEYIQVMNKVAQEEFHLLGENVYHTKDGDVSVFLRWLELPKEDTKAPDQKDIDAKLDAFIGDAPPPAGDPAKVKGKGKKKPKAETIDYDFESQVGGDQSDRENYEELPDV